MTVVAMWIDWTAQHNPRLLCFADSLVSNTQTSADITPHAAKLFRVPVFVHHMDEFDPHTGSLTQPYYSTAVGMAYSGDTVLFLSIIGVLSQTLTHLAISGPNRPLLSGHDIALHIESVVTQVNASYKAIDPGRTDIAVLFEEASKFFVKHWIVRPSGVVESPTDIYEKWLSFGSGRSDFENEVHRRGSYRDELTKLSGLIRTTSDPVKRSEYDTDLAVTRMSASANLRDSIESVVNSGRNGIGGTLQMMEISGGSVSLRGTTDDVLGLANSHMVGPFSVVLVQER